MKSYCALLIVLAGGLAAVVGCAVGEDADPSESFLTGTPIEAGTENDESVRIPAPSNPAAPSDDPDAGEDEDAGTPPIGDAGVKQDAGGTPDGGTVPGTCAAPNTCPVATHLGSVSGDKNADTKSAQGHTSQWFTVRVTENDSSIDGRELRLTSTLISPPGTNYNLYVYVPGSDTRECNAVSNQSLLTTSTDKTTSKFGEGGLFSNGSDDDRTVTVEVRWVSGTCDPTKPWTLTLEGNK